MAWQNGLELELTCLMITVSDEVHDGVSTLPLQRSCEKRGGLDCVSVAFDKEEGSHSCSRQEYSGTVDLLDYAHLHESLQPFAW